MHPWIRIHMEILKCVQHGLNGRYKQTKEDFGKNVEKKKNRRRREWGSSLATKRIATQQWVMDKANELNHFFKRSEIAANVCHAPGCRASPILSHITAAVNFPTPLSLTADEAKTDIGRLQPRWWMSETSLKLCRQSGWTSPADLHL